jgi:PAS domain S-box-containing protein
MIKELTHAAWSILAKYENDEKVGLLSKEEAQKTAVSRIQYLRYGDEAKDYFWITDMKPTMVMHPHRIDLNGKDLNDFTDPHGKHMFVEFVKTARSNGFGYVDYMWQWKDDSTQIVPKLSYVKLFKPWGWIIGTGVYLEDVKREIQILTRKLTYISVGIGVLLSILLVYILKQSISAERKRLKTENQLHETKEKYRTMVEAATEGLLMLVDGRISFANPVIKKIVGFETEDVVGKTMAEILSSEERKNLPDQLKAQKLSDGQFEMTLVKKDGSATDVLVDISTTKYNGQDVNIVIFKDLSYTKLIPISGVDFQRFARELGVGYFKLELDTHGRFAFANDMAIKLLGFSDFAALSSKGFAELLSNSYSYKDVKEQIIEKGHAKNIQLHILNQFNELSALKISLVADVALGGEMLGCDGIVENISHDFYQQQAQENALNLFVTPTLVLQAKVKELVNKVYTIHSMATIQEANTKLSELETTCLIVVDGLNNPIGIVTTDDFRHRVVALSLKSDNPIYMIMSSPIISCDEHYTANEAMIQCNKMGVNHLLVRDPKNLFVGVFNSNTVYSKIYEAGSGLVRRVTMAANQQQLKAAYQSFQQVLLPLIKSGVNPRVVFSMASELSDAIIVRAIELAINEQGQPPVQFAFICLGSEGRQEETLVTDQDNALVYANVPDELAASTQSYFMLLAQKVCRTLNAVGYAYCLGNMMAQNPQYCLPLDAWKRQFMGWINTPDSKAILDASVFFDLRTVYGDNALTQALHAAIENGIMKQPLFLYHMALNSSNVKLPSLASSNLLHDKAAESFDLKQAIAPITMLVRTYALRHRLSVSNTFKRLELLQEHQVLTSVKAAEMLGVYAFLMKLRLQSQAELLHEGHGVHNLLNSKKMTELDLSTLKKALAQIHEFQDAIRIDFRLST